MYEVSRKEIISYGIKMIDEGLTFGAGGNLSIRTDSGMLITPSGIEYSNLHSGDIVHMKFNGEILHGYFKPSSEFQLHSEIYKKRKDIGAIIHTHSKYISVLAAKGEDLKAAYYLVAESGDSIVRVAPYETYGTEKLAIEAVEYLENRKAVILANHGLVACGKNIKEAYSIARDLEFCAFVQIMASISGKVNIIPDEKINELIEKFSHHGQKR